MTIYVGDELKQWRTRHELTQAELARLVGVEIQTLQRWEQGEATSTSRRPNKYTTPLLAKAIKKVETRAAKREREVVAV